MHVPFRLNGTLIAVYLLLAMLSYLAGTYFGRILLYLFYVILLTPIFSMGIAIFVYANLKYFQTFSSDHPVKGETLLFKYTISNETSFPILHLFLIFSAVHPGEKHTEDGHSLSIAAHTQIERHLTVTCKFRGTYKVGVKELRIRDFLGFLTIYAPVWKRTFYVYPRIYNLPSLWQPVFSRYKHNSRLEPSDKGNYSSFNTLKEYKENTPAKYIAWKRYFSLGIPLITTFNSFTRSGAYIFLDLRTKQVRTEQVLSGEDCSIEIATALIRYFCNHAIPVVFRAYGEREYYFSKTGANNFNNFYSSTIHLYFSYRAPSPARVYDMNSEHILSGASVFFITHAADGELLKLAGVPKDAIHERYTILSTAGLSVEETFMTRNLIRKLPRAAETIRTISDSSKIIKGLS